MGDQDNVEDGVMSARPEPLAVPTVTVPTTNSARVKEDSVQSPAVRHTWPRKLHLSYYFMDDTMPAAVAAHVQVLRDENPGWTIKVWGPAQVDALMATSRYRDLIPKYKSLRYPIQRSDFSRYMILHAEGGVYMDLDYVLKGTLDDLVHAIDLHDPAHLSGAFVNETPNNVIRKSLSNSLMASREPGHPFWRHVLALAGPGADGASKHVQVIYGTGPQLIDRAVRTYRGGGKSDASAVGSLPKAAFNPCSVCDRGSAVKAKTNAPGVVAYHDAAGAWNGSSSKLYNTLLCDLPWVVGVSVLGLALLAFVIAFAVYYRKAQVKMP